MPLIAIIVNGIGANVTRPGIEGPKEVFNQKEEKIMACCAEESDGVEKLKTI